MNDTKLTIIIAQNYDISAITSLLQCNDNSWECFIINNSVKNIDKYIIDNKQFKILNGSSNLNIINDAINRASGDYILILDAKDIVISDIIDVISYISDFTNSDIIKFESKQEYVSTDKTTKNKYKFKYIFNKQILTDYISNPLSEFCFKKNVIQDINFTNSISFLTGALSTAKDMTITRKTCVIHQQSDILTINDIIDNYKINHDKLSYDFWKNYFKTITPNIIRYAIKNNDKNNFIIFCKQIPLNLIPLRYRLMCYILKKTNK